MGLISATSSATTNAMAKPHTPLIVDTPGSPKQSWPLVAEWARHDLSLWYPGRTVLVVAARGLDPGQAARLVFESGLVELS
jgi:hypothetical protein